MKTFRRILIALSVIALLVSSAVVIVGAEEVTVEALNAEFQKVDSTKDFPTQASQMKDVYAYMSRNEVPAGAAGRDELYTSINQKSVEIATGLANLVVDTAASSDMMTAYKDVLTHMQNCPITPGVSVSYASVEELLKVKSAAIANKIYNETKAAGTADAAKLNTTRLGYISFYKWIEANPIDATANATLLENASKGALDCGKALLATYTGEYLDRFAAASWLTDFLTKVDLSKADSPEATALASSAAENYAAIQAEVEQKKTALDALADFDEYDYIYRYTKDFNDGKLKNSQDGGYNFANSSADYYCTVVEENGEKFLAMIHGEKDSKHLYGSFPGKNLSSLGYVIEMDVKFEGGTAGFNMQMHKSGAALASSFFVASLNASTGKVNISLVKTQYQSVMTLDTWNHIILTFDPVTLAGKCYVNYEEIGTFFYPESSAFDIRESDLFRYQANTDSKNMTVYLDNFLGYNGTSYRKVDKFDLMADADKFEYYVNYFTRPTESPLSRNKAYVKAKALVGDPAIIEAHPDLVQIVNEYNYETEIKIPAIAINIQKLTEMVSKFDEVDPNTGEKVMPITSETKAEVAAYIVSVDAFISNNSELIDKSATEYRNQVARVNQAKNDLVKIENVEAFVAAIGKFQRATSARSMNAHYASAKAIYELANYNDYSNVEFIENDKVVRDFELKLNGEEVLPDSEEYVTLFEYYDTIEELIYAREGFENAVTLTNSLKFITSLEGYEATEAFWAANAEAIEGYVTGAREIIFYGNYDRTYEGIDETVDALIALDAYFYEALQNVHIETIKAQLTKFESTSSYIEKMGAIVYLERYFEENDLAIMKGEMLPKPVYDRVVDEMATLEELLYIATVYYAEIESGLHEDDYKAILAANTQSFIGTVEEMTAFTAYADVKPLFDKATEYYYAMNVDTDAAKAAIEIYHSYRDTLADIEFNSTMFIGAVKVLGQAAALEGVDKEDKTFLALVDCMKYVDGVDETYEGVKAAKEVYTKALDEYNADADAVNGEIAEITKASCAVRTKSIVYTVLAIIGKIFED